MMPENPSRDQQTTPAWHDWDAEARGLMCEAGVGVTIGARHAAWLSWDETVALHRWLGEKIEGHLNGQ